MWARKMSRKDKKFWRSVYLVMSLALSSMDLMVYLRTRETCAVLVDVILLAVIMAVVSKFEPISI